MQPAPQPTQSASVLASLQFAVERAKTPPRRWSAICLVRIDLVWKVPVALPPPPSLAEEANEAASPSVGALWRVDHPGECSGLAPAATPPMVSDVLLHLHLPGSLCSPGRLPLARALRLPR